MSAYYKRSIYCDMEKILLKDIKMHGVKLLGIVMQPLTSVSVRVTQLSHGITR